MRIVGVSFKTAGKIYYFDPLNFDIKQGDHVIVETKRGVEYGRVVLPIQDINEELKTELKPVIRIATSDDDAVYERHQKQEKQAMEICRKKISEHKLDMKLVSAEYTFDETKILFYFTSEGRVDFRELVKDLALEFKTRIELRQIGVRDESKVMGSVGVCGRGLCCSSWLEEFVPVSIKMAKEQGLSLNPSKISGACGRLMCCLKYEQEAYEDLIKNTPGAGVKVRTPDGDGVVESVALLQGKVRVIIEKNDEKTINEYFVDQVERIGANNENLPEEEIN